jgi:Spy/CpxP family protein refolding chaperone
MSRAWSCRALAILFLLAMAAPVGAQSFAWWKSDQFQKEVGLTVEQCTRIDNVFQSTLPKLRQGRDELDKQEAELSRMIEANADEALVVKQVDRVEATRATLGKMRTLMLFHMHQVLTADQLAKFKIAHDKWIQEHPPKPR